MPAENAANMSLQNYDALWKTVSLGLVKEIDPSNFQLVTKDKVIGKVGVVIDKVVMGFAGSVRTVLHQVDKTVWQQLCPWWSSGSVQMAPGTRLYSEYDNAGLLRLHPVGNADATHDLTFTKAFPRVQAARGDGENWRELTVDWDIFMDQSLLLATTPTIGGAYIGDPPS